STTWLFSKVRLKWNKLVWQLKKLVKLRHKLSVDETVKEIMDMFILLMKKLPPMRCKITKTKFMN
ncbi:MAG: hypothetical protein IIU57_01215, partial [Oscillospiraceae bacterium]|nr:hypothetical protein [Oscillospiraceae bacterium]